MTEADADPPIVSLAFRAMGGAHAYLEGKPAPRIYIEKHDLRAQVQDYIAEGKLTLDPEGTRSPRLIDVEGRGGFYVALLDDGELRRGDADETPNMQPLTVFDEERHILRLIKDGRQHEFAELVGLYSGAPRRRGSTDRTVVMLDRGSAMAWLWGLWEELQKIRVARFLAGSAAVLHVNSTLLSFGGAPRWEHSVDHVTPDDAETVWGPALAEAALVDPMKLLAVSDGSALSPEPMGTLADLAESGVQVQLIVVRGLDEEWGLQGDLSSALGLNVSELRTGGDLVRMVKGLADWV
jgi:hypothetical protein